MNNKLVSMPSFLKDKDVNELISAIKTAYGTTISSEEKTAILGNLYTSYLGKINRMEDAEISLFFAKVLSSTTLDDFVHLVSFLRAFLSHNDNTDMANLLSLTGSKLNPKIAATLLEIASPDQKLDKIYLFLTSIPLGVYPNYSLFACETLKNIAQDKQKENAPILFEALQKCFNLRDRLNIQIEGVPQSLKLDNSASAVGDFVGVMLQQNRKALKDTDYSVIGELLIKIPVIHLREAVNAIMVAAKQNPFQIQLEMLDTIINTVWSIQRQSAFPFSIN